MHHNENNKDLEDKVVIQTLKEDIVRLTEELKHSSIENEQISQVGTLYKEELESLQDEFSNFKKMNVELSSQMSNMESYKNNVKETLEKKDQQIEEINQNVVDLNWKISELTKQLNVRDGGIVFANLDQRRKEFIFLDEKTKDETNAKLKHKNSELYSQYYILWEENEVSLKQIKESEENFARKLIVLYNQIEKYHRENRKLNEEMSVLKKELVQNHGVKTLGKGEEEPEMNKFENLDDFTKIGDYKFELGKHGKVNFNKVVIEKIDSNVEGDLIIGTNEFTYDPNAQVNYKSIEIEGISGDIEGDFIFE